MISTKPNLQSQIAAYQGKQRRRQRWYRIVSALACVVVFCTTYALILPAITMETQRVLDCRYEVHTHTDECYDGDGNLICGQANFVVHVHNDDCYDKDGSLVCPLPEIEAHTHADECYAETRTLICELGEDPGHQHASECYAWTKKVVCGQEESAGHAHSDECYEIEYDGETGEELARTLICLQEEHPGHLHTDECYEDVQELACGEEEREPGHIHTEECYETALTLACEKEEVVLHTHTGKCYEDIYDEETGEVTGRRLVCGQLEILEHVHTGKCFVLVDVEESEAPSQTYAYEDESIAAEVTLAEGSALPEGTELVVRPITGMTAYSLDGETGDDGYEDLVRRAEEAVGQPAADILLYDISFYTPDGEYLPVEDSATVSLRFKEAVFPEGTGEVTVLHFQEDGDLPEVLEAVDVTRDGNDEVSAVTFETGGFSTFGIMPLADTTGSTPMTLYLYKSDGVGTTTPVIIDGSNDNTITITPTPAAVSPSHSWIPLSDLRQYYQLDGPSDTDDSGLSPFYYSTTDGGELIQASYNYNKLDGQEAEWYVDVTASSEIYLYYTVYNKEAVTNFQLQLYRKFAGESSFKNIPTDSTDGVLSAILRLKKLDGTSTDYYLIPEKYLTPLFDDLDPNDDTLVPIMQYGTNENTLTALDHVFIGDTGYAKVRASHDENGQPYCNIYLTIQSGTSSFTLTYNGYTITFNIVDSEGTPLFANCSDIVAENATRYIFGPASAQSLAEEGNIVANIVPEIEDYTYSGATVSQNGNTFNIYSVGTDGYTGAYGGTVSGFKFYTAEPLDSGQFLSWGYADYTVTLTYAKVNQVDQFMLWLYADMTDSNKIAGYSLGAATWETDDAYAALNDVLRIENTNYYLIPITYFTQNYSSLGFTFDPDDPGTCPFYYTPNALYNTADNQTAASYAQVGSNWYVQIADTGTYTSPDIPRSNVYYNPPASPTDGITPKGTVINLFDYWIDTQDAVDVGVNNGNGGINAGHALKFSYNGGADSNLWNKWTGSAAPYKEIVGKTLSGGYPYLNSSTTTSSESLAYLFDPTYEGNSYRTAHRNVSNLLQVDAQGYYYYNSQQNFAEYDEGTNSFILYDDWGVKPGGGAQGTDGQFFPFNSYEQVKDLTSVNTALNHYFGMTLTTRFVHRYDGYTNSARKEATTFEFSGDDDVWIFVDDVLVADLGGIHDRASVKIDFSTGKVYINDTETTTLYDAFAAAGKTDMVQWSEDLNEDSHSDTFANNTYHTLKFYYLERGNTDSNLYLKYNLASYPPTSVNKVNQYGAKVPGAEFSVYKATVDNDGNWKYGSESVYTGTTNADGEMVFVDEDKMPYTLTELKNMFGEYFVLKETKAPAGYRLVSDEIKLHIVNNKVLLCENTYDSGVWADSNLQVSAPNTIRLVNTNYNEQNGRVQVVDDNGTEVGTIFAVVLKYTGPRNADGNANTTELEKQENWSPVYGTAKDGFTVVDVAGEDFIQAVIDTAKQYKESANEFSLGSSGALEGSLNGMPGEITSYYYMLGENEKGKTQYTVAYYWTKAASLAGANTNNTYRVDANDQTYGFDRVFGATINVPNLVNTLFAQKFNEEGELINGATFALYKVEEDETDKGKIYYLDTDGNRVSLDNATYTIDPGTGQINGTTNYTPFTITPYQTKPTLAKGVSGNLSQEDGTATFTNLEKGKYYLREIAAPKGYELNETEVMVLVTDNALYANAGTEDDGVAVARGTGYVVSTLDQFASEGDIDNTLTWLYERMRVTGVSHTFYAFEQNNAAGWHYLTEDGAARDTDPPFTVHLRYDANASSQLFNYVVNTEWYTDQDLDATAVPRRLTTNVGWSYYELYQDYDYGAKQVKNTGAAYQNLEGQEIAHLFSRAIYVRVTDKKAVGDLEISKIVVPDTKTAFLFTLKLFDPENDTVALDGSYAYTVYDVDANGKRIAVEGTSSTITSGTLTFSLSNSQVIVIEGLPYGAHYAIKETKETETGLTGYTVLVSTNGGEEVDSAETNGTLTWNGNRDGNVCTVDYINALLPLVQITKVDSKVTDTVLAGAQFVMHRVTENNVTQYYDNGTWVELKDGKTEADYAMTTPDNGELLFANLDQNGAYHLKEIAAPDGYNKLTQEIVFTVTDGKVTVTSENSDEYQEKGTDHDGQQLNLLVKNLSGFELPETGGMGTLLYYATGGTLLMAGCLLCGYKLRRKSERRYRR